MMKTAFEIYQEEIMQLIEDGYTVVYDGMAETMLKKAGNTITVRMQDETE